MMVALSITPDEPTDNCNPYTVLLDVSTHMLTDGAEASISVASLSRPVYASRWTQSPCTVHIPPNGESNRHHMTARKENHE